PAELLAGGRGCAVRGSVLPQPTLGSVRAAGGADAVRPGPGAHARRPVRHLVLQCRHLDGVRRHRADRGDGLRAARARGRGQRARLLAGCLGVLLPGHQRRRLARRPDVPEDLRRPGRRVRGRAAVLPVDGGGHAGLCGSAVRRLRPPPAPAAGAARADGLRPGRPWATGSRRSTPAPGTMAAPGWVTEAGSARIRRGWRPTAPWTRPTRPSAWCWPPGSARTWPGS